ncbi:MAG: translocation/assembly module TamB domain-containing protein, partial [Calditrichaeota bacterium]|nr:translocation/assembly module TamB domain-containing protein [Calditrichota bacterium]
DNLVINSADINFLNSEIKVRGEKALSWNPDQPDSIFSDKYLELFVEIKEDSLNFLNAINPELERLVGDITANAHLKGDYDNPQFEALAFSVKDGRFYLSKVENSIDDINTSGHLEGTRLVIDDFTARSPKPKRRGNFLQRWFQSVKSLFYEEPVRGDIRGSGWVDLADVTRPRVNLSMNIDDAYFNYFLENTQVVIDTRNLTVTGRDTILVAGDITIVEGDVEFDFVESEKNLLFETNVREEPPFVIYNLNIEIPSNFNVRSYETLNSFDMAIDGELRVISQPRSELEMSGSLNTSGVYFVQGEEFKIEDGKIEFVNPKELPELNLTARTFKKDQIRDQQLTFLLNVHGKIDSPEKEIVIQDEQGNVLNYEVKDQLALLLFGMTFDQLGGSDAQDILLSRGEQVLTQALVSSIEREARTFTGLDQIRLDQQDSFFSSKLNQPSTLSLGKYLTPNLYLEYRSRLASTGLGNVPAPQLSWEAGNQIYLQYRLNRSWSFSTIYQKTLEGNNKVQFDINWQTGF